MIRLWRFPGVWRQHYRTLRKYNTIWSSFTISFRLSLFSDFLVNRRCQ